MTKTWSFFNELTGEFTGQQFSGPEKYLQSNTPSGTLAIGGQFDRQESRVDITTMEVVAWTPPKPEDTELLEFSWDASTSRWIAKPTDLALEVGARSERDRLLSSSDWTQIADAALSDSQVIEWRVYRQQLRDLQNLQGFPGSIVWPTPPEQG